MSSSIKTTSISPEFSLELYEYMENLLDKMHSFIREGEECLPPMYLMVKFAGGADLKRFHLEDKTRVDFPPILLDTTDVQIAQIVEKQTIVKFALIGYSIKKNGINRLIVEAYGHHTQGAFVMSHTFSGLGLNADLTLKDPALDHYEFHNPLLLQLNRSAMRKSSFELPKKQD